MEETQSGFIQYTYFKTVAKGISTEEKMNMAFIKIL